MSCASLHWVRRWNRCRVADGHGWWQEHPHAARDKKDQKSCSGSWTGVCFQDWVNMVVSGFRCRFRFSLPHREVLRCCLRPMNCCNIQRQRAHTGISKTWQRVCPKLDPNATCFPSNFHQFLWLFHKSLICWTHSEEPLPCHSQSIILTHSFHSGCCRPVCQ